jgi:hypothetical protein
MIEGRPLHAQNDLGHMLSVVGWGTAGERGGFAEILPSCHFQKK